MVAKSFFHRQVMLRHLTWFLEWAPHTQTPHKSLEDLVILSTNPSANREERERSLVDSRLLYKRGWKQLHMFTKEWEDGSMKDKTLLFPLYKNAISTQNYSCHYSCTSCPQVLVVSTSQSLFGSIDSVMSQKWWNQELMISWVWRSHYLIATLN